MRIGGNEPEVTTIDVIGAGTIKIPEEDTGTVTTPYTAIVRDQAGNVMVEEVTWSVEDDDGSDVDGGYVTIDSDGVVTVKGGATAQQDSFKVVATSETDPGISGELTVNLEEIVSDEAVDLGTAGDYVILSYAGITNDLTSDITGDIGVSPLTSITGFELTMDSSNVFATSDQVDGRVYASNYAVPTPANLTTAVGDKGTAYTDAAGRAADHTGLHAGDLSGETLVPGVYKWDTNVVINDDVTLDGAADDVWIFQISGQLTQAANTSIILDGDAQAKNIFWQVTETVSIGTEAHFEGIVLGWTNITLGTGASVNGRLFALNASVTLLGNIIKEPQ